MIKKKLKLKWKIIFSIVLIVLLLFLSARFIGTKGLSIREYKVVNKNLPNSFYGLKVVHFTDLHYGMSVDEVVLSNLVNKINEVKPDIVFFTGDLIDRNTAYTEDLENMLIKYLTKIKSTYGNYYIDGNHDKYKRSFTSLMDKSNFKSLNNSFDVITSNSNENIFIAGFDINTDTSFLDNINDYSYKIGIMHYPDNYDNISKYNFDLVLAGHSHNGQIRLPITPSFLRVHDAKTYYDRYCKVNNTDFYISGGIGNSTLNLRLFNPPSFNLYRLVDK